MSLLRKRKASPSRDEAIVSSRKHARIAPLSSNANMKLTRTANLQGNDATTTPVSISTSRKSSNKRSHDAEAVAPRSAKRRRDEEEDIVVTPQRKRFCTTIPPSPVETPSRKTAKLFERIDLQDQRSKQPAAYSTPPSTPDALDVDFADILPASLLELTKLHSAFLGALNNQTALNSSGRISIKELLKTMTSIWRKRDVLLEDLQKLMALCMKQDVTWKLEDYGRAGICLIRDDHEPNNSVSILDTIKLKRGFENNLRSKWARWLNGRPTNPTAEAFIEQLPLISIPRSDTIDKTAILMSRGRTRLSGIKSAQAAAAISTVEEEVKAEMKSAKAVQSRGTNLLDRILAKQSAAESLPAGPSREQLERRSALQRVEEIARVLDILSAGRARASFSMPSVVQQLQQSLRNPISRVDVERCVHLMAAEIMPQFVTIIMSGSVVGVVITRAGKLGIADLKKTLADLDV